MEQIVAVVKPWASNLSIGHGVPLRIRCRSIASRATIPASTPTGNA